MRGHPQLSVCFLTPLRHPLPITPFSPPCPTPKIQFEIKFNFSSLNSDWNKKHHCMKKGGIKQRRKFPEKVMVWLGACSKDVGAFGDSRWRNSRSYCLYQKSASRCIKLWEWNFWSRLGLSTGWRQAILASFNTTTVSKQFSIIYWQWLLASKQSRFESFGLFNLGWTCQYYQLEQSQVKNNIDWIIKIIVQKTFSNQLFLKVALVGGPVDCIACFKMMEIIYVNKNKTIL